MRKGYSDSDIKKILGLNTLRLLEDVQRVAATLAKQKH
jgi:microsomal dipeptidase-like Zn-dependent dipeptidase